MNGSVVVTASAPAHMSHFRLHAMYAGLGVEINLKHAQSTARQAIRRLNFGFVAII